MQILSGSRVWKRGGGGGGGVGRTVQFFVCILVAGTWLGQLPLLLSLRYLTKYKSRLLQIFGEFPLSGVWCLNVEQ